MIVLALMFSPKKEETKRTNIMNIDCSVSEFKYNNHDYHVFKFRNNFKQIIHSPDCQCLKKNDFFPF